jgi:hypothetical protein
VHWAFSDERRTDCVVGIVQPNSIRTQNPKKKVGDLFSLAESAVIGERQLARPHARARPTARQKQNKQNKTSKNNNKQTNLLKSF